MSRLIFAFVLLLGGTLSCFAQTGVLPSYRNASGGTTEVSAANPFPTSASVSVAGFHQESVLAPFTASSVSSSSSAFTAGKVVIVSNAGATNTAYCQLGNTATTSSQPIPPASWIALTSSNETTFSCITSASTTTINTSVGTGIATGAGGGGGSGGGGAITAAASSYSAGAFSAGTGVDGWDLTQGAKADAACASDVATCTEISLQKRALQGISTLIANTSTVLGGVTQAQTGAAASSLVAKASAGSLISISGSAVVNSYIMLFNATSAPVDGAVTPVKCWGPMAAAGPFSFSWGAGPVLTLSTGITVVSSSTGCFTKTATNANFISAEYQ